MFNQEFLFGTADLWNPPACFSRKTTPRRWRRITTLEITVVPSRGFEYATGLRWIYHSRHSEMRSSSWNVEQHYLCWYARWLISLSSKLHSQKRFIDNKGIRRPTCGIPLRTSDVSIGLTEELKSGAICCAVPVLNTFNCSSSSRFKKSEDSLIFLGRKAYEEKKKNTVHNIIGFQLLNNVVLSHVAVRRLRVDLHALCRTGRESCEWYKMRNDPVSPLLCPLSYFRARSKLWPDSYVSRHSLQTFQADCHIVSLSIPQNTEVTAA